MTDEGCPSMWTWELSSLKTVVWSWLWHRIGTLMKHKALKEIYESKMNVMEQRLQTLPCSFFQSLSLLLESADTSTEQKRPLWIITFILKVFDYYIFNIQPVLQALLDRFLGKNTWNSYSKRRFTSEVPQWFGGLSTSAYNPDLSNFKAFSLWIRNLFIVNIQHRSFHAYFFAMIQMWTIGGMTGNEGRNYMSEDSQTTDLNRSLCIALTTGQHNCNLISTIVQ